MRVCPRCLFSQLLISSSSSETGSCTFLLGGGKGVALSMTKAHHSFSWVGSNLGTNARACWPLNTFQGVPVGSSGGACRAVCTLHVLYEQHVHTFSWIECSVEVGSTPRTYASGGRPIYRRGGPPRFYGKLCGGVVWVLTASVGSGSPRWTTGAVGGCCSGCRRATGWDRRSKEK